MDTKRTTLGNITFDNEGVRIDAVRIPADAIGADVQIIKHDARPEPLVAVTLTLYAEQVNVDNMSKGANVSIKHT